MWWDGVISKDGYKSALLLRQLFIGNKINCGEITKYNKLEWEAVRWKDKSGKECCDPRECRIWKIKTFREIVEIRKFHINSKLALIFSGNKYICKSCI